jgi:hypothetical protein
MGVRIWWHNPCVRHLYVEDLRMRDSTDRSAASTNGGRSHGHAGAELSAAALFTLLWDALADLLGTAATAVVLRRAVRRATPRSPELAELSIVREDLGYRYALPSAWNGRDGGSQAALGHLVAELLPLLVELAGPLVVRHLAQIPELRERGIIPPQETEP